MSVHRLTTNTPIRSSALTMGHRVGAMSIAPLFLLAITAVVAAAATTTMRYPAEEEGRKGGIRPKTAGFPYSWQENTHRGIGRRVQNDEEEEGGKKTLTTTFSQDNGSFGCMFDVVALENDIIITSLDIHTDLTLFATVEVYTKESTFVDSKTDQDAWDLVAQAYVQANGLFNPTPIPSDDFEPIRVTKGSSQAIYVTLQTPDLLYTSYDGGIGDVYASDTDMEVRAGVGVRGYPFGGEDDDFTRTPRIFNGNIHYDVASVTPTPTASPTVVLPTVSPTLTMQPTYRYQDEVKTLETTYDAGNGAYGAMFIIEGKKDMILRSMDFHADAKAGDSITVEVYTRKGSYEGVENRPGAWRLIANATVVARGEGSPTPIPEEEFETVRLYEGDRHAFYVTLTTKDLEYTNTAQDLGDVFSSNSDMDFFVGLGVAQYPFGDVYEQRVFNGELHYSLADIPTEAPTPAPTTVEAMEYKVDKELESTFSGGNGSYGAMFDIRALHGLVVRSLEINTNISDDVTTVVVYTRPGTHTGYERDETQWTKVVDGATVVGKGQGHGSRISSVDFQPVTVPQGETQAFYVSLPTHNLTYTSTTQDLNSVFTENVEMQFLVGSGVGSTTFDGDTKIYPQRVFNGKLHYSIHTDHPTPAPTEPPKGAETVMTQQRIDIIGVDPTGELGEESAQFFAETTKTFLNSLLLSSEGVHVDSVEVTPPDEVTFEQGRRMSVIRVHAAPKGGSRRRRQQAEEDDVPKDFVLVDGSSQTDNGKEVYNDSGIVHEKDLGMNDTATSDNSTISSSNETLVEEEDASANDDPPEDSGPKQYSIYTTISGSYTPPPYVDFTTLVESSFQDEGDTFVRELKEDEFFEEAEGVATETVRFNLPEPEPSSKSSRVMLIAIYASCGFVAAVITLAFAIHIYRKRNGKRKNLTQVGKTDDYNGTQPSLSAFAAEPCIVTMAEEEEDYKPNALLAADSRFVMDENEFAESAIYRDDEFAESAIYRGDSQ